jgi:NAD(P)-dependent dehydrogenase (short-subunit alcohol dehydrogenase family)
MRVDVDGVMRMTRAVVPLMLEAGRGTIVNVGSEASFRGSVAGVAYTASKHAVLGLTKSCSVMYAPKGIRVNMVAPGGVRTSIVAPMSSQFGAARVGPLFQANMPPRAEATELAAAITYLLSDDSANISGAVLASDGGWSAV